MVNSFDVFDTLIGRITDSGHVIFDILEKYFNLANFKQFRIQYECETENFDRTYTLLEERYNQRLDHVKQKEIDLEYELSFPILKYIALLKSEDILISDMYLSHDNIIQLLNKHRHIQNKLYVSYGGKRNNIVWKDKNLTSIINLHYGDNIISDYENPMKNGINAVHIKDTVYSKIEDNISRLNIFLSSLIKATRLSFVYDHLLFNPFVNYILPFTVIVCLKLKQIMKENNIKQMIFLARDGYWFKVMYDILFPEDNSKYIYFSRLLCLNNRSEVINSINQIPGSKLVFDLQGSGNTFNNLNLSDCKYFMCFKSYNCKCDYYLYSPLEHNISLIQPYIEDLCLAPHGSAEKYVDGIITLLDPEHDISLFSSYFQGFSIFSKYYNILKKYINIDINFNNLEYVIRNFHSDHSTVKSLNLQAVTSIIPHVENHTDTYSRKPLVYYSQIGQDKYFIEKISKYKPFGVFLEIGGYDGLVGSNTFFCEKNLGWSGIIVECNPELAQLCIKNRKCIVSNKAVHVTDDDNVTFIIPRGDEIIGGKEQLGGIKGSIRKGNFSSFSGSYKTTKEIICKTITVNSLLEQHNIYEVDYLSLDTEGNELDILKSIDYTKYKIKYLTIEHGECEQYQKEIYAFLSNQGFNRVRINRWDDEYCLGKMYDIT